jgi:hypothetical protein
VLEVVEGDDDVGEHQRHVGQADRVRVRAGEALDGAHAVVAEDADGAAGERREVGADGLAVLGHGVGGERVRVAAVAERPAQHAARLVADERPAADGLPLLRRLQQEGGAGASQLEERGHRRLRVLDQRLGDRDQAVPTLVAGEDADLVERRGDDAGERRQVLSDAGQAAPLRRRGG